jgi:hypothetical protein
MTDYRALAAESREVPEGCELVAVEDHAWRLVAGKRCRYTTGPGHQSCKKPSVAELNRTRMQPTVHPDGAEGWKTVDYWWPYCESHCFGRWVEDGKVMRWVLREKTDG